VTDGLSWHGSQFSINHSHQYQSLLRYYRQIRYSLFWDVTQRRVIVTDGSGHPVGPIFKVSVSEHPVCPIFKGPVTSVKTINLRCVTSQKSEYLVHISAEAREILRSVWIIKTSQVVVLVKMIAVLIPARGTYCTSVLWILIAASAIANQLCKLLRTPGQSWPTSLSGR